LKAALYPSGRRYDPFEPTLDDIDIRDIAHSLSLICRFNGHCRQFYSVAQHSILVSLLVPEPAALEGLMHDAAEAYIQDIITPIKHDARFSEYLCLEEKWSASIATRFGLGVETWAKTIEIADRQALATELAHLVHPEEFLRVNDKKIELATDQLIAMPPPDAEAAFLSRFSSLSRAR
jgi:5'-deoxynucleotidase YfbR-like HD superfamily hydrolase